MARKTLGLLLVGVFVACATALNIAISGTTTHAISPTLYGHSGDGGLYGELLQNRAFQAVTAGTSAALTAWEVVNGVSLSVVSSAPVSSSLPNNLQVTIASGTTGTVAFANTGYWGIKITSGSNYTSSFYVKSSNYAGPISVSLQGASSKTIYATATPVFKVTGTYTKYTFTLIPTASAPDSNNIFVVHLTASGASTTSFGLFSLFPPTYKNRPNGMRVDLATIMAATSPKIWRFPGGNNLEGETIATRWKWNETIGPLEQRPGRLGDWGYPNTDGLGLMEYMQWAEDIGAEIILGVWAGYALGGSPRTVPQAQLQPYITDVINEIHFLTDASTTTWGALRAKYGRTDPYPLTYIEVGNEDFLDQATYASYRWPMYVNQLKAAFPNLKFIDTAHASLALSPKASYIDYHNYNTPSWFATNAQMFDSYNRSLQYFVGEYAAISTNASNLYGTTAQGRLAYPTLQGAVGEAAFMTGMERNSDCVFASAYAPSLQHINGTQWTPDLITFDAYSYVRSASYWVQHMFSNNFGTHVLSTTPAAGTSPVWWVASINENTNTYYLKVANTGASAVAATISLGFSVASPANTTSLSTYATAFNTLTVPNTVYPRYSTVAVTGGNSISFTFPAYGVVVFKMVKA